MASKVLVLNPEIALTKKPDGLVPTTWDPDSYWIFKDFKFSRAFESHSMSEVSPFFLLDARLALVIKLLDLQLATALINVPELASILFFLRSNLGNFSSLALEQYWNEYSLKPMEKIPEAACQQFLFFNSFEPAHDLSSAQLIYFVSFEASTSISIHGFKLAEEWKYEEEDQLGKLYIAKFSK